MALVILLVFNLDKALKIWGAIGNTFLKVSAFLNILAATVLLTIFRGLKAGGLRHLPPGIWKRSASTRERFSCW
ncbi:MAG: hypothetical protein R3F31_26835 [Verrucomicrobiales bacterium]